MLSICFAMKSWLVKNVNKVHSSRHSTIYIKEKTKKDTILNARGSMNLAENMWNLRISISLLSYQRITMIF
jgi:hypothetical protein